MINLKRLPGATEQEVFDQLVRHLLTQNQRSADETGGVCLYRNGALMCAAGCLISADEYSAEIESESWSQLIKTNQVPDAHSGLINRLQATHDWVPINCWRDELLDIAEAFDLSTDVFVGL
jgi:hypothetical protein